MRILRPLPKEHSGTVERLQASEPANLALNCSSQLSVVSWSLEISESQFHHLGNGLNNFCLGAPGWLSQLGICLQLRSWSQGPGMKPHIRLPAQWSSLLSGGSPSTPHPGLCGLSLSNKIIFLKKEVFGMPGRLSSWASAFSSGHDPGVLGSSPTSSFPQEAYFSLCISCGSHE